MERDEHKSWDLAERVKMLVSPSSTAFVLVDPGLFSGTRFKVLKNQQSGSFVPCVKSLYNGMIKLTYLTNGYVALSNYYSQVDCETLRSFLIRFAKAVVSVQDNGFLAVRNISFNPEQVYLHVDDGAVGLLYLPLDAPVSGATETEACQGVFRLCASALSGSSGKDYMAILESRAYREGDLQGLLGMLSEAELNTERTRIGAWGDADEQAGRFKEDASSSLLSTGEQTVSNSPSKGYTLVSRDGKYKISMNRARGILGKHPKRADYVVQSGAVSRVHCELSMRMGGLYVSDLGSVNGTFVNGRRLKEGELAELVEGSQLRVADMDFIVGRSR